ncbi:MAG TPA: hypothetical protein VGD13_12585 [Xanthobacteraceae bacterium]|jgi:hypothetical protein
MGLRAIEMVDDEICSAVRAAIEGRTVLPVTSTARKILAAHPLDDLSEAELTADLAAAALVARVPIEVG